MHEENDETRLQAVMDENQHLRVTHEERLTKVETRVITIEAKLPYLETAIGKLTEIVGLHEKQGALNEQAIIAIRERTDQFAEHLEKTADRLATKQEVDDTRIGKLESRVESQGVKWTLVQAVAIAALGVLMTIALQHLSALLH